MCDQLISVELRMLPGEQEAATKFLQSKVQGQIRVHEGRVEIEDEKAREVKQLLHKFLHHEGLTGYRVLSQLGIVRIVPTNGPGSEDGKNEDKIKGVPPFPPLSQERLPLMNVIYPNYSSRGFGYKKKKR